MERLPQFNGVFRASLSDNSFLDYHGVGYNKAPYYPFRGYDSPGSQRSDMAGYLSMHSDMRENLTARGKASRLPRFNTTRHPIVLDQRELERQGAQFNTTAMLQNPANYLNYGPVDEFNPAGAPAYLQGAQMGRQFVARSPWN
jgi:hypothetical protein